MNYMRIAMAATLAAGLSGCGTLSGFSGSSSFACKAPDGVTCTSMSGIYANQDQLIGKGAAARPDAAPSAKGTRFNGFLPVTTGTPIMSQTEILRVWFAPWRDSENDMHDESIVYTVKSQGHWLIEEHRGRLEKSNTVFSIQNLKSADDPARKVNLDTEN